MIYFFRGTTPGAIRRKAEEMSKPLTDVDFAGLDRGIRPAVAEFLDFLQLRKADPSAQHLGGNYAVRDHQLRGNTVWGNCKSGWYEEGNRLYFSPVNWARAADPDRPDRSLDLVEIVVLRPGELKFGLVDRTLTVELPQVDHFVVPASALRGCATKESDARAWAPLEKMRPYLITETNPLTPGRLSDLIAQHAAAT